MIPRRYLFTADWHLTENAADAYRWVFVEETLPKIVRARKADHVFVLGDLTHDKDGHSGRLLCRLRRALKGLAAVSGSGRVDVVVGNHDYPTGGVPALKAIAPPKVRVHVKPKVVEMFGRKFLMLPHPPVHWPAHSTDPDVPSIRTPDIDFHLFHASISGSRLGPDLELSTGEIGPDYFRDRILVGPGKRGPPTGALAVGGDIHVPQTIGRATYTGAPYPINFGDEFEPRVLIYNDTKPELSVGRLQTVPVPTIRKLMIDLLADESLPNLQACDQIKVRLSLTRTRFDEAAAIRKRLRKEAEQAGAVLRGVEVVELRKRETAEIRAKSRWSPKEALHAYAEAGRIDPDVLAVGDAVLEAVT